MNKSWQCPYCNRHATIGHGDRSVFFRHIKPFTQGKHYLVGIESIICPNVECKQLSLFFVVFISKDDYESDGIYVDSHGKCRIGRGIHDKNYVDYFDVHKKWSLLPETTAKSFPDYIPTAILEDYKQACLIKDKSPKASATLARRCLQSIIRDFFDIKDKNTLKQEIDSIKDEVSGDIWEAIHVVRKMGAIGAHMEKDVNSIIDIDPEEADRLIWLIEFLIENLYIRRYEDREKLKEVRQMGEKKAEERKSGTTS